MHAQGSEGRRRIWTATWPEPISVGAPGAIIRAGRDDGSGLSLTVEVTEGRTAVASTDWLARVVGSGDTAAGSSASDEVCTFPKREMTLEPSAGTEVLRAGPVSVAGRDVLVAAPRGYTESAIATTVSRAR